MRAESVAIDRLSRQNLPGANALRLFDFIVILICLVLLPSAVLHGLWGVDERTVFAVLSPVVVGGALIFNRLKIRTATRLLIVGVVIVGVVGSIIADAASQMLMGAVLAVAILAGRTLFLTLQKPAALRAASLFTLSLLIGGVIGLLYAFFVGRPLLEVQVGYRTSGLYLTTFSLAQVGNFIRPSGIFDEPGAFAMFAIMITMFNDVLGRNQRLNIVILALVVFTGSMAGVILLLLYFITSNVSNIYGRRGLIAVAILAASGAAFYLASPGNPVAKAVDAFYSGRLEIVDGRLAGDNRSGQVDEFFSLVDGEILARGAVAASRASEQYDQSSNPFSIVYSYGLIISLPYFGLLLWLFGITLKNRFENSYASLGLLFLLLQRPYVYNMMWAPMVAAVVWLIYAASRERMARRASRA